MHEQEKIRKNRKKANWEKLKMALTTKEVSLKYDITSFFYDFFEFPIEVLLFRKWRKELLKDVNCKVLEIGVGTGKNLPYYDFYKVKLTAVDISRGMLKKAKNRAETKKYPVTFKLLNSEKLPFKDNSFEYIIVTFVLCSVSNQLETLKEIKRVLEPNGKVLFLEHVLSKNKFIAFLEKMHNPIMKFLTGANINRDTVGSIKKSGLKILSEENLALKDVFKKIVVKK
ncbi:class I SAM-dependent methyltransferase [Candidatus Woesearchaeota archaeon]|nr:class I SAM-dependent methyltransferase [Candidatus Woesearchaeota archaeon]